MKALILLYHRVALPGADPWALCVSPEHFSEHMEVLRRIAYPCTLSELVRAHAANSIPENAVAVTFDDGYLDNLTNARPILEEHDVPATIFVCSGAVGRRQEFWWDQLERALLRSPEKLPERLELDIDGKRMTWSLEEDDRLGDGHDWRARHPLPHAVSRSLFYSVWEHLRALPPAAQADAMRQIRLWSGTPNEARWDYRTLDADDLVKMADSRLIAIGAHTVNHPLLPAHPREFRRLEILNGRSELQDVIGRPVRHFAYPYGDYDQTTVDILREEGFASACTTVDRAVTPRSVAHELPRVMVHDWTSEQFRKVIQEKLSDADAISGTYQVGFTMEQAPNPYISDKIKNKTVLIIHPAWHSCGSHAVFCCQSKAYKALGAKVISLAVGTTLSHHSSNCVFWNRYYSRTADLIADARFHTGPSRSAFMRPSSIRAILKNLFADYAQQRAGLAELSPIQPELFASDIALVHCNHYFNMPFALRFRATREIPILLETHDVQARQYELRGAKALFRNRRDSFEKLLKSELSHCAMADYLIHINAEEMSLFSDPLPGKPHALLYPCIPVLYPCMPVVAETRAQQFFLIVASAIIQIS